MTFNELAHEIAAEHSASIIECYGVEVKNSIGHVLWYEMDVNDKYASEDIRRALIYLDAAKMLRRNPRNRMQVKVKR